MATFSGNDGIVKTGSNAIAEVTSFTVNQTSATIRDTSMGDTWESHLGGLKSWDGSIECHWDDTDSNGQVALTVGSSVTLNLYAEGDTTGDHELTGTATITGVTQSQSFDNALVSRSFTFQGSGALTIGTAS